MRLEQQRSQDEMYIKNQILYLISARSTDEVDIEEILSRSLINKKIISISQYHSSPKLEYDSSSIEPHIEIKNDTSLLKEHLEETIPENILESDIVVRIAPKRRYAIEIEVKKIRKGEPSIVKPEDLL